MLSGCVCVRNLIFCTDENESEIQFSIHLMHLTLPRAHAHTATRIRMNSEHPFAIVLW